MQIAVDTGGTFTDCVYLTPEGLRILKLPSTPADPGAAILTATRQIAGHQPVEVRHGTTVGTNALLERKGARVAFITTAGFEDTIAIGRQNRPRLYDLFFQKPAPLVPEQLRFGVQERTACDGTILQPVTNLGQLVEAVAAAQPEAIAVSLLFAFANPANEQAVCRALETLGVPISASHKLLPEFREYERASTIVINAYLAPKMQSYLGALDQELNLSVMQSSGGIIDAKTAAAEPAFPKPWHSTWAAHPPMWPWSTAPTVLKPPLNRKSRACPWPSRCCAFTQ
jgi:N-methylhydantoinase A